MLKHHDPPSLTQSWLRHESSKNSLFVPKSITHQLMCSVWTQSIFLYVPGKFHLLTLGNLGYFLHNGFVNPLALELLTHSNVAMCSRRNTPAHSPISHQWKHRQSPSQGRCDFSFCHARKPGSWYEFFFLFHTMTPHFLKKKICNRNLTLSPVFCV